MSIQIQAITENDIEGFAKAVGSVARELQFLAFTDAPPIDSTINFVKSNSKENWPHFIAKRDAEIIGWCDISSLHRPAFEHSGVLGMGIIKEYRGKGVGST